MKQAKSLLLIDGELIFDVDMRILRSDSNTKWITSKDITNLYYETFTFYDENSHYVKKEVTLTKCDTGYLISTPMRTYSRIMKKGEFEILYKEHTRKVNIMSVL